MASCIPMLRVLFRDLRGTSLTEISGTGGKYHKSSRATETSRGGDVEAAAAESPTPANGENNNTPPQDAPAADSASQDSEPPQKTPWWKPWGSFWDAGMGSRVPRSLRRKSVSAPSATRQPPFALAENSSQRVLVQTPAGESTTAASAQGQGQGQGEVPAAAAAAATRGERGIIQTQEFELTYAERRPRRASSPGYELERVGIGAAR